MRTTLLKLVTAIAATPGLPGPIVELGGARAESQRAIPPVASFFPGRVVHTSDMRAGIGVTHVQDIEGLGLADASVGTFLLFDMIEHVRRPWLAMEELRRCLSPGGVVVMTSVFSFPIHAHPDDYWRFTASGFEALVERFEPIAVRAIGPALMPHTVVAVAGGTAVDPELSRALRDTVDRWCRRGATSWKERMAMVLPPPLLARAYDRYQRARS